jgi:hypothetical protein
MTQPRFSIEAGAIRPTAAPPLGRWERTAIFDAHKHAKRVLLPRFVARIWAHWFDYFYLPCPICNQMMAGFEWDGRSIPYRDKDNGQGYCNRHEPAAVIRVGLWAEDYEAIDSLESMARVVADRAADNAINAQLAAGGHQESNEGAAP